MSTARSSTLTRRLAATLAAVLVIDLVFVGVVVALLAPLITGVGSAVAPVVPDLVWLAAAGAVLLAGFLVVQLRTARRATLESVDATPADDALRERVARLARVADAPPPSVGVVDSDVPNCFSVGGSDPTIVVSRGLLDRLDDDELDAVLAHELAHLRNRDATVLTLATFLPTLISDEPVAGLPEPVRSNLAGGLIVFLGIAAALRGSITDPVVLVASVAASVLIGGVFLGVLATPVVYLSHRLSHDREFVADRAGARIAGDPAALASALRKLDDDVESPPTTDLRSTGDLVSELCLLPGGFVREDRPLIDDEDGFTVRLRSHPPTDERIARLRDLQAGQERAPAP